MITRCYLEITNICNLDCVFCPKTERKKQQLSLKDFQRLTDRLAGQIKFLYFHLMGEPFLHLLLPQFIRIAREKGFIPVLTTNGTLLSKRPELLETLPHKLQISLHSQEGNQRLDTNTYLDEVMTFAQSAAKRGSIIVLRLWNQGGHDRLNEAILAQIAKRQPQPWMERKDGWKLTDNLFLEYDRMFEWPDLNHDDYASNEVFCYALRNQIGVLVDGTVVPCCLDHGGDLALGNLYDQSLEDILSAPRARAIYEGFSRHTAVEPLCQRCGYAMVVKQYRKG